MVTNGFVSGALLVDKEPKAEFKSPNALCETGGVDTGAVTGVGIAVTGVGA